MTDRPTMVQAMTSPRLMNMGLYEPQVELARKVEHDACAVIAAGRRGGKTRFAAGVALFDLCLRPELDELVLPGEARFSVVVACNVDQARRLHEAARLITDGSPLLRRLFEGATSDELRFKLPNGRRGVLKCFACTSRGSRGWPISTLVLDETAHMLTTDGNDRAAEQIFGALRPAQAQFGDLGRALLISSPMGDENWFAKQWKRADAGLLPGWGAYKYTSKELNPSLTDAFMEQARAEDEASYPSEYEAVFERGDSHAYFDMSRIHVDPDLDEAEPDTASTWVAGLDPSTSVNDFGLALIGQTGEALALGPVRAISPEKTARKLKTFALVRTNQDKTLAEVAELCRRYSARTYSDQHLSSEIMNQLTEMGVHASVEPMTRETKHRAFAELRGLLYSGRLTLYDHPSLLDELARVRVKVESGGPRVILGRSGQNHSDSVQALALAAAKVRHFGGGESRPRAARGVTTVGDIWNKSF